MSLLNINMNISYLFKVSLKFKKMLKNLDASCNQIWLLFWRNTFTACLASSSSIWPLRHKHGHSGMLSYSLTNSKPLRVAEIILDLDGMGVVVKRTSERWLHFLAQCLSITISPRPSLWVIHSIMHTQACRDRYTLQLSLHLCSNH